MLLKFILIFCLCHAAFSSSPTSPSKNSKILMLLPLASHSHRNCFLPLAKSLADRGHKIVILSPLPQALKHPNITELNHGVPMPIKNMFELREKGNMEMFYQFKSVLPKYAEEVYSKSIVNDLYEKRDEFDLIVINELFGEISYPFLVGKYFISISTPGFLPASSSTLGNVLNPSYIPSAKFEFQRPYSIKDRMINLFASVSFTVYFQNFIIVPAMENTLKKKFSNLPPLGEIKKGLVLNLANTHFTMDIPIPLLPSQVEVGGMHCRPGKKLPEDLREFIEESSHGIIYFSLGSVCKGETLPEKYKMILIEAFRKLKQKIIWKYEADIENLPKNVLIKDWIPQQDILAHPNVKLFITHGGLLSMQESIYHGKPLLALPVFADQDKNAYKIQNMGIGKFLLWETITVESLQSTIKEILNNPTYKNKVNNMSLAFRDQPESPVQRAVWWTEYIIRHRGAPHLKSPAADISWREYLMMDIFIGFQICLFSAYWLIKKLASHVFSKLMSKVYNDLKGEKKKKA